MKTAFNPRAFQSSGFQIFTPEEGFTGVLPYNISFVEWANQLRNTNPTQNIPIVSSEKDWKNFSSMLKLNMCFDGKFLPESSQFTDWRDWASEFLLSIGA